jgi:LCP family protein required for cell wall assembly
VSGTDGAPRRAIEPEKPARTRREKGEGKKRRPWLTAAKVLLTVILALAAALAADVAVLARRIDRVAITPSAAVSSAHSQTWLIVGADTKPVYDSATGEEIPMGARADIVIVVQIPDDGSPARILSIPRDLTIRYDAAGHMERLTLLLKPGADWLAAGLCQGLGIPVDHFAMVTIDGMEALVDAVGGIQVTTEYPLREFEYEPPYELRFELPQAGTQTLDGEQAFGLVRARQAEQLIDGEWVPMTTAEGNAFRARNATVVIDAFIARVKSEILNLPLMQGLAWTATDNVTVDAGTTVADLLKLALALESDVEVLPVLALDMEESAWTSLVSAETTDVLATYDYYPGGCVRGG